MFSLDVIIGSLIVMTFIIIIGYRYDKYQSAHHNKAHCNFCDYVRFETGIGHRKDGISHDL